jgi:hypothetical protein
MLLKEDRIKDIRMSRRGRRHKKMDVLKENGKFWNSKEVALDRIVCKTRIGKDFGPVARDIT